MFGTHDIWIGWGSTRGSPILSSWQAREGLYFRWLKGKQVQERLSLAGQTGAFPPCFPLNQSVKYFIRRWFGTPKTDKHGIGQKNCLVSFNWPRPICWNNLAISVIITSLAVGLGPFNNHSWFRHTGRNVPPAKQTVEQSREQGEWRKVENSRDNNRAQEKQMRTVDVAQYLCVHNCCVKVAERVMVQVRQSG